MEVESAHPLRDVVDSHERLTQDELGNLGVVLGAYRSFRGARRAHLAYVSMPITSGKRYYDVLSEHGVVNVADLAAKLGKDALYELVIKPNIAQGIALADKLGQERNDMLFIAPSVFEAKRWRWSQDAYMSLWYRVIGELAGKVFVMDGWEYSTGGVKEVLFAMLMRWRVIRSYNMRNGARELNLANFHPGLSDDELWKEIKEMWTIRVFDEGGEELHYDDALDKVLTALEYLELRGLIPQDLLQTAVALRKMPIRSPFFVGGTREEKIHLTSPRVTATQNRFDDLVRRRVHA